MQLCISCGVLLAYLTCYCYALPKPLNTTSKLLCTSNGRPPFTNCTHGNFSCKTQRCVCKIGFTGKTCSIRIKHIHDPGSTWSTLWDQHETTTDAATTMGELPFKVLQSDETLCISVNGRRVVRIADGEDMYAEIGDRRSCDCMTGICLNDTLSDKCKPNPCFQGRCFRLYNISNAHGDIKLGKPHYKCLCNNIKLLQERFDFFDEGVYPNCKICSRGQWGPNCMTCGKCDGPCHPLKGCSKCQPGWEEPPECINFRSCNDLAVNCHEGQCIQKFGFCLCQGGYTGADCSIRDPTAHEYQAEPGNCDDLGCVGGSCLNIESDNYPIPGMLHPTCFCPEGKYFSDGKCHTGCREGKATCMFGTCVRNAAGVQKCVCSPGYEGRNCSIPCSTGQRGQYRNVPRYGDKCRRVCGRCIHLPCDHVNGSCAPFGCFPGWAGEKCKTPNVTNEAHWSKVISNVNLDFSGRWSEVLHNKSSREYRILTQTIHQLNQDAIIKGNLQYLTELEDWELNLVSKGSIKVDYFIFLSPGVTKSVKTFDRKFGLALEKSGKFLKGNSYKIVPGSVKVKTVHIPPTPDAVSGSNDNSSYKRTTAIVSLVTVSAAISVIIMFFMYMWKTRKTKSRFYPQQVARTRTRVKNVQHYPNSPYAGKSSTFS